MNDENDNPQLLTTMTNNCIDSDNTSSTTTVIVIDDDFVTTRRPLRQRRRDEKKSNNNDDTDDDDEDTDDDAIPIPLATATVMSSRDKGGKKNDRERKNDKRTRRRTRVRDYGVIQRRRLLLVSSTERQLQQQQQQQECERTPPRSFDDIRKLSTAANTITTSTTSQKSITIIKKKNDDNDDDATATITASINDSGSSSIPIPTTAIAQVVAKRLYHITIIVLVMNEILLLLQYHTSSTTTMTTVQLILDRVAMLGWTHRVHHVAFVFVHIVKGIVFTIQYATTKITTSIMKMRQQQYQQHQVTLSTTISFLWMALQFAWHFGIVLLCCLAILPLFDNNTCTTNNNDYSTCDLSPFIKWSSSTQQQHYDWWYSTTTTTNATTKNVIIVTHPRYSIVDILINKVYQQITASIKTKITERVIREAYYGLLRPFHFHTKLRKLLRALHYIKFIGPLIGTCNKCRGHVLDMIAKRRLYCKSKLAQKYWTRVIDELSCQTNQERVVLILQRRFREKRERISRRRFALLSSSSSQILNTNTIDNVQHLHDRMRTQLADECLKSKTSLRKIELIEEKQKLLQQITMLDRGNITQHKHTERTRKKRLLLSPRTNFAVLWKYVTISCALIEISQFIFAPSLVGEMKKMPLDVFLGKVIMIGQRGYNSIFYYNDNVLIVVSHIVITTLVATINTITFLDVFITFFTGEIIAQTSTSTANNNTVTPSSSTVVLVPKSFFTRWIIPGIGLQLIVNPTMSLFSSGAKYLFVHVIVMQNHHGIVVGPSLLLHLLLSIMPFVIVIYDRILDVIFDFVERQNTKK
jgi:hypothetical protein